MPRLTPDERRLLRRTSDLVRMYVAVASFISPVACALVATYRYRELAKVPHDVPQVPQMATYGTISGIYLPIFAAVAAYVWATRAAPARNPAPHGFAMALFRDCFTLLVVTTVLILPALLYLFGGVVERVNTFLVWYQTFITAAAGGAFTYYFHASLAPASDRPADAPPGDSRRPGPARAEAPAPARGAAPRTRRARRTPGRGKTDGGGAEEA